MTETKTKICEVSVDISSLFFVSRTKMHVLTAQPTAVRTAYCVIASNSWYLVISSGPTSSIDTSYLVCDYNLSKSYLV